MDARALVYDNVILVPGRVCGMLNYTVSYRLYVNDYMIIGKETVVAKFKYYPKVWL
jgi:hypothetical protein